MRSLFVGVLLIWLWGGGCVFAAEQRQLPEGVFASVAGEFITLEQYHAFYAERLRQQFYHGKIPEAELDRFGEDVLQQLVDRVLLRQEALRRKLVVDESKVQQEMNEWKSVRGADAPAEMERLERQKRYDLMLIEAVQESVEQAVAMPSEKAMRAYYAANQEKFTRPEQLKVSLILLKVEPYVAASVWQAAYDKAQGLLDRIESGEVFAQVAQAYSEHESSAKGGDLGFVHVGMLSSEVQEVVNGLVVGEVVDKPMVLLQGVALLRLDGRRASAVVEYDQAKERVAALLLKDRREQLWGELLASLRERNAVVLLGQ